MDWDADFLARSPLLEPLSGYARAFRGHTGWPRREALQPLLDARGLSNAAERKLRLVPPPGDGYEERIRVHGEISFREGEWHDIFNVLAWLVYPALKAALNEAHYQAASGKNWGQTRYFGSTPSKAPKIESDPGFSQRGPRRDALTLFDESGAIVLSSDENLLEDLRAFRWKRLFVERRGDVRAAMRFHVVGHALFEKALRPYVGMTAHALLLPVGADVIAQPLARRVATCDVLAAGALPALTSPRALSPLPVLGVPGWWPDNERAAFYDNAAYFRSGRRNPGG